MSIYRVFEQKFKDVGKLYYFYHIIIIFCRLYLINLFLESSVIKKSHVYSGFVDCILSVTGCADKEIVDDVGVSFRIIDKNDDDKY